MSGELAAKVRLVRCPKCRLLLPEFPHYNVYKCGGCGTTLQAKRQTSEAVNSEPSSHESEATLRNTLDLVSENTSSKKEQLVFPQENVEGEKATISEDISSKKEQLVFPQENVEGTKATISFSGECALDVNSNRDQNDNGPRENDQRANATSSSSGMRFLVENGGRDQNSNGECNGEQLETINLSDEDLENKMDTNRCSDEDLHELSNKGRSNELTQCEVEAADTDLQLAGSEEAINGNLSLEGAEEELSSESDGEDTKNGEDTKTDKSALVGVESAVDITGNDSTSKRSSTENFDSEKGSISHIIPRISKEDITSDNVLSLTEQLKQAESSMNFVEHVRSMDESDATEVINLSSELSDTFGELSNSPTTKSSHAYDGSISSYDGIDEQIPYHQHSNPLDNTKSVADAVFEGRPGRAKGLVHSTIYGDSKVHQHSMKYSSGFPSGKHDVIHVGEREDFQSKMPFHYSVSHSGYESGSPSTQLLDELYCSSTFLPSDSCEEPEEKMELMRMICKLQDQLNRTSSLNGRPSTSTSYDVKHISSYHSHDLKDERFCHGLDFPRCNGRCDHGINWCQRHKFSLRPCSAEASSSTHHVDLSCFRCYPHEWQCPAELPPHVLCQREGLCRCHPGHNCCSSHHSYPLNTQWFMGHSKPPLYGRETKSDDQRLQAHEGKKYFSEKQNMAYQHLRPVAGGAPFVTCHHCFRLLQLPADFLLFKRVRHKLKCGSCSEVLKFSLMNRSHIVSYIPSELSDQSKVVNESNRLSESHTNTCSSSQGDRVSYSDDYGLSVSKSYSSEGDPVSLTAFRPLHNSEYDHIVSRGTSKPVIKEKGNIASRYSSSSETPAETNESAERVFNMFVSEKVSSQMEARPPLPPRNSPLHQLMGYTSPSQVIRGIQSSDECDLIINKENYTGNGEEL